MYIVSVCCMCVYVLCDGLFQPFSGAVPYPLDSGEVHTSNNYNNNNNVHLFIYLNAHLFPGFCKAAGVQVV